VELLDITVAPTPTPAPVASVQGLGMFNMPSPTSLSPDFHSQAASNNCYPAKRAATSRRNMVLSDSPSPQVVEAGGTQ
jgi:hypothetical protein